MNREPAFFSCLFFLSLFLGYLMNFSDGKPNRGGEFYAQGYIPFITFLMLSVVLSIAILIRPTNIIFLPVFVFLDTSLIKEAGNRILFFLNPRYSLPFLVILFVVFILMISCYNLKLTWNYNIFPASVWSWDDEMKGTGALFVFSVEDSAGKMVVFRSVNIDKFAKKRGEWAKS